MTDHSKHDHRNEGRDHAAEGHVHDDNAPGAHDARGTAPDEHADDEEGHAGHDHAGHAHAPPDRMTRAFVLGMLLNVAFVVIGVFAGFAARSTALLADAAHNMGDVLGLGMAWGAMVLARRARTARRTYGLRRTTILAALGNGGLVLFAIGAVVWEAIQRLTSTPAVDGGIVAIVAAIGVVLNVLAAMLFAKGREGDMNIRAAFLHLIADAAVSAGVVVAGLIVWKTGWSWVDPATSLLVSVVILAGTWKLVREALNLLLDAVPDHVNPIDVEAFLRARPGVTGVHDLHIWSMSTTEVALTAHLVVPWETCSPRLVADLCEQIEKRFKIGHATIQLEPADHPKHCEQGSQGTV